MDIIGFIDKITFLKRANKSLSSECWEWLGTKRQQTKNRTTPAYGTLKIKNKNYFAHRVSYLLHFGMFDYGLQVQHKCHNPPCVNPHHLKLGTVKDNKKDQMDAGRDPNLNKTHCPLGHPFSGKNLYRTKNKRHCRICRNSASEVRRKTEAYREYHREYNKQRLSKNREKINSRRRELYSLKKESLK